MISWGFPLSATPNRSLNHINLGKVNRVLINVEKGETLL